MKWLSFAVHNTLRNRRRSIVTAIVAAFGTAAILVASGFALSTYRALEQSAARDTGHLIIARNAYFQREEDVPLQYGIDHYDLLRDKLLADPQVRYVLPRIQISGLISNGDKSLIMAGAGVDPATELRIKGPFLKMVSGAMLDGSEPPESNQVIIGEGLAKSLDAVPGSGLTLMTTTTAGTLNALDVEVKGVFTAGVPEIDKRFIYTSLATAQSLVVTDRVGTVGVFLKDMAATTPTQQRMAASVGPGFTVHTWHDHAVLYNSVKDLYNRIFGALGLIIALIVIFVTGNAMAMAIIERTREIGSLRALGTSPRQLVGVFAMEGATLGGAGALLGALFALTLSIFLIFVHVEMPPPPGRTTGYPLQLAISLPVYTAVVCSITALSLICSAIVGRRAAKRSIVEALNHV